MVESLSEAKNENESAFDKFWDEFQLFPSKSEDKLFKQRRWIILAAIGPLFLLVLESALISQTRYQEIRPSIMFRDLGDPIFTYISLALLAGGWMFVQIWRADIKNGFRSVVDNKLIEDNVHTDYRDFLQAYRRQLQPAAIAQPQTLHPCGPFYHFGHSGSHVGFINARFYVS